MLRLARRPSALRCRPAAFVVAALAAAALAGALAGCGSSSEAGGTAASSSSASAKASASSSAAVNEPLNVETDGNASVLVRSRHSVSFTVSFAGGAPAQWVWRVRNYYGRQMTVQTGEAGVDTATLTWDGKNADGDPADAGLYLVEVGPSADSAKYMTTVGRIRFQPPVKAKVYTCLPAAGRKVALTFDDGGGATAWYWILRALRDGHAKGTFFPIGDYVGDYANREAELTVQGHMAIGSHSWSHPDLTTLSDAEIRAQLKMTDDVWWDDFKVSTVPYLRPPYGSYNARVLKVAGQMGYSHIIMWDVDSRDWENPGVDAIVRNVLANVRNGSIIVLHTRGKAPKALPRIIEGLHERHYEMVTIPQLFRAAGVE